MDEVILHHYPLSPFAEKIRRILAYKQIPWRAVEQPMMAPKPDLTALTGGYRRIPVMQIGADIYCDTACIVRRLEQLRPAPTCLPKGLAGLAALLEDWADHRLFSQTMPPTVIELLPALPPDILVDRAAMSPMMTKDMLSFAAPHALSQTLLSLDRLDAQLRDQPFLLGETFSIADAACFHPIWFLKNSSELFAAVTARPALAAWFARIEGFGPGQMRPMSTGEALATARDSSPRDTSGGEVQPTDRVAVGDNVVITADDYGREEVSGIVVRLGADEITVLRHDPTVGEVAVHFPRAGYRVRRG